jgi:hypothetical protein
MRKRFCASQIVEEEARSRSLLRERLNLATVLRIPRVGIRQDSTETVRRRPTGTPPPHPRRGFACLLDTLPLNTLSSSLC